MNDQIAAGLAAITAQNLIKYCQILCSCTFLEHEVLLYTLCAGRYMDHVEQYETDELSPATPITIQMTLGTIRELRPYVSRIVIGNAIAIARMYGNIYILAAIETRDRDTTFVSRSLGEHSQFGDLFALRVAVHTNNTQLKREILSEIDKQYYNWDAMTCGRESIIANMYID